MDAETQRSTRIITKRHMKIYEKKNIYRWSTSSLVVNVLDCDILDSEL